jgi:hypothetical protein
LSTFSSAAMSATSVKMWEGGGFSAAPGGFF